MLKKLDVRIKLILIMLFPLLGLLFFSVNNISNRIETYNEMEKIQELTELSVQISRFIHETQKERGRTAGFLGANGKGFVKELKDQRLLTDTLYRDMYDNLVSFTYKNFGDNFISLINDVLNRMNQLSSIRSRISDLNIKVDEAIGYYTNMNAVFLDIVGYTSKLSSDSEITVDIFSYTNFLQSKERSGIERAVLSNTFSANKFADSMYNRFISLVAMQDTYLSVFSKSSPKEYLDFYNEQMRDNSIAEVEKLRSIAIAKSTQGDFGVDSGVWFDTITLKINQLKKVDDYIAEELLKRVIDLKNFSRLSLVISISITVLIIVLSILLSLYLIGNIMSQIGGEPTKVLNIALKIASGDFTSDIKVKNGDSNSILFAMKKISTDLSQTISKIITVAEEVSVGADQVSQSSQILSEKSVALSTHGQQVNSNVSDLESTVTENAKNANSGEKIARVASENAEKGGEAVNKTVVSMKKIANTISVIQEIANNISLLSLNASIEAARAGEYGKGFSVVATEVSKLAEKTLNSAKDIVELTTENVKDAEIAGELIGQVVPSILETFKVVQGISYASKEQSEGVRQLNKSSEEFENITMALSSSSEELASTAEEISAQSESLVQLVKTFKINRNGFIPV